MHHLVCYHHMMRHTATYNKRIAPILVVCRSVTTHVQHHPAAPNAQYEDTANGADSIADLKVHPCNTLTLQFASAFRDGIVAFANIHMPPKSLSHHIYGVHANIRLTSMTPRLKFRAQAAEHMETADDVVPALEPLDKMDYR